MTSSNLENAASRIIESRIKAATVYTNQALVVRQSQLELTGAEQELIIEGLPLSLQQDSVRSRGVGNVPVKILGVQTEQVFSSEPIEQRTAEINQEIQAIAAEIQKLEDQIVGINLQRNFVQDLGSKYLERFSSLQPPNEVNLDEISRLLGFIGSQDQSLAGQITQYKQEKANRENQLEVLRDRLKQVQTKTNRDRYSHYRILLAIEPESAGTFELEISYLVNYASWSPLYDIRSNTTGDQLHLTYLAEVKQKTGEDWIGINLTLSTAKPSLGKLPNKLKPFFIQSGGFRTRESADELAGRPRSYPAEFFELDALLEEPVPSMDLSAEVKIEAEQAIAETTQVGGIVTFSLERNSTIPSDDQAHKVMLYQTHYAGQPQHITVPRLDSCAYLETQAINPADGATLLPGKANIFRDNTLVGTTELEHISPGQSFKVYLGIDESIKVSRDLVKREVESIGTYRRINYSYRIRLSNLRAEETKIRVIEQLPVSRDERIKVRLLRTQPEILEGEMGTLEWLLVLAPKSQPESRQEIAYQSSTEYPTNLAIEYSS
ncbi:MULTISPECIES: mucoidy inhibitor MuiA family protein [Planktothricoides]|uniref:Mucoidy inhibitor MuiA family protein n=2 Tax=Planktothricoides raciborskii TaxID=132608 RepID=A0AAU8J751_9CYAN|nr:MULTISPECIES: mucoidy inhibitor MuiA family protein [Planktothricoides]KOR34758.1 hypothetical protein AM228_22285 [Planktothricoides sp. SR001]MBD2547116.1 mucoidy inhibitor MuiA family protein [Planktothricoides raciborskii FACHB-1370]MBD2585670.1 mucoidy inhibitor MuiA family protein [Planktothricoides raciborskii FACHB-1261]